MEGVLARQLDDAVFLRIAVQADGALLRQHRLRWSLVRKGCDEAASGWVDDLGVSEWFVPGQLEAAGRGHHARGLKNEGEGPLLLLRKAIRPGQSEKTGGVYA